MQRDARLALSTPVVLTWNDDRGDIKFVRGHAVDISVSGLLVEVCESIPLRSYVSLNAPKISLTTSASVRHCIGMAGKYHVGLEFSCPMKNLVDRLARQAAAPPQ